MRLNQGRFPRSGTRVTLCAISSAPERVRGRVHGGAFPMAVNIPFAFLAYVWHDERKASPGELNQGFVDLVKARFGPDDTLLVSCRSGGRAAMATNMLAAAELTNAYNILDGMEGCRGRRPRQRLPRDAAAQRLEGLRPAVDIRPRPRTDGTARARDRHPPPRQPRGLTVDRAVTVLPTAPTRPYPRRLSRGGRRGCGSRVVRRAADADPKDKKD